MTEPEQAALAGALQQLGVPADKAPALAAPLDKRAHQLAERDCRTHQDGLLHLLQLMKTAHNERQQS